MNDVSKQQLSALLDGESSPDETRFLLRRVQSDPELADLWNRYQLIRDGLRAGGVPVAVDLGPGVMQRIQAESCEPAPQHGMPRWLRYGVGGSIAAGVAVFALAWMQPLTHSSRPGRLAGEAIATGASARTLASAAEPDIAAGIAAEAATAAPQPNMNARLSYGPYLHVQPAAAVRSYRTPMVMRHPAPRRPAWLRAGTSRAAQQHDTRVLVVRPVSRTPLAGAGDTPLPQRRARFTTQ